MTGRGGVSAGVGIVGADLDLVAALRASAPELLTELEAADQAMGEAQVRGDWRALEKGSGRYERASRRVRAWKRARLEPWPRP